MPNPNTQPALLRISVEADWERARHGHPIDSDYVETFWTPALGPSAVIMLRTIHRLHQTHHGHPISIATADLAAMCGLGAGTARNSALGRTITRLIQFDPAQQDDTGALTVWSHLRTVPTHLQRRWPRCLTEGHQTHTTQTRQRAR